MQGFSFPDWSIWKLNVTMRSSAQCISRYSRNCADEKRSGANPAAWAFALKTQSGESAQIQR